VSAPATLEGGGRHRIALGGLLKRRAGGGGGRAGADAEGRLSTMQNMPALSTLCLSAALDKQRAATVRSGSDASRAACENAAHRSHKTLFAEERWRGRTVARAATPALVLCWACGKKLASPVLAAGRRALLPAEDGRLASVAVKRTPAVATGGSSSMAP